MKHSADLELSGEEQSISGPSKQRYSTCSTHGRQITRSLDNSLDPFLSPLCHVCRQIKFADFSWMNENRIFKPYPEWRGTTGCINATQAEFYRGRPKLGSIPEVLSRAGSCTFCCVVSDKFRKRGDFDSIQDMSCYLEAVQFCIDSTLRDQAPSRSEDTDTSEATKQRRYAFEPILPGLKNFWDRTTTHLEVVIQESGDDLWMSTRRSRRTTLIRFQPSTTPVPMVLDSLKITRPMPKYCGRLLNPNGVDPELLRFWLDRCERKHGAECASASLAPHLDSIAGLLFIDVVDSCIVEGCNTSRFVALSYVWGTTNTVVLTKKSFPRLAIKGALRNLALPATIRDAITVTRRLGIQFLWVDALCIRQDDEMHQGSQIAQMASVYASALLTIVAAAGDHANAGLSRVSTPWNTKIQVINVPGVSLIPVLDYFEYFAPGQLLTSKWYSRAWTMQEHLLSTRELIFTENQVYWHCPQSRWVEETELEYGHPTGYLGYHFGWLDHSSDVFGSYQWSIDRQYRKYDPGISTLVKSREGATKTVSWPSLYEDLAIRFMTRDLTSESDRLKAFTGILNALSALTREQFVWGLPESRFCYALTWNLPNQHRTYASQTFQSKESGRKSFFLPSWSFIAWKSSRTHYLHFGFMDEIDSSKGAEDFFSEVVIYQLDALGGRRQIDGKEPSGTAFSIPQYPRPMHLWKLSPVTVAPNNHKFDPLRDIGLLQFWSTTATLRLCRGEAGSGRGHFIFSNYFNLRGIYDRRMNRCLQACEPYLAPEDSGTVTTSNTKCHKQSIVIADLVVIGSKLTGDGDDKEWMLHALIVKWHHGVAYRIGIATISEYVWVKLGHRIWKLVTLG
jgi:hypothetical protein